MTGKGLHTLALWLPACACLAQAPVLRAQVLPNTLTVTSATAPLYQANQTITTSGTVTLANGASTTFEAGTTVDLKPGFHASVWSKFPIDVAPQRRHADPCDRSSVQPITSGQWISSRDSKRIVR